MDTPDWPDEKIRTIALRYIRKHCMKETEWRFTVLDALAQQPKSFASRNPVGGLTGVNSSMRELASAAVAAMAPTRFTSPQRQTAQRPRGLLAVAAVQRVQGASALR